MKIMIETFKANGIIKQHEEKSVGVFFPSLTICSKLNNLNLNSSKCLYASNGLSLKHNCHFTVQNHCLKFQTKHLLSNSLRSEEIHISLNVKPFYEPQSGTLDFAQNLYFYFDEKNENYYYNLGYHTFCTLSRHIFVDQIQNITLDSIKSNCILYSKLQKKFEIKNTNDLLKEREIHLIFRIDRDILNIEEKLNIFKLSFWQFQFDRFGYIEKSMLFLIIFRIFVLIFKCLNKKSKNIEKIFDEEPNENYFEILLKLPEGESIQRKFSKDDRILKIYEFLKVFYDIEHTVKFILKYPKIQQISINDSHLKLNEFNFEQKITLFISNN
eukprot:gene10360-2889_t